jgi:hypothetical protein
LRDLIKLDLHNYYLIMINTSFYIVEMKREMSCIKFTQWFDLHIISLREWKSTFLYCISFSRIKLNYHYMLIRNQEFDERNISCYWKERYHKCLKKCYFHNRYIFSSLFLFSRSAYKKKCIVILFFFSVQKNFDCFYSSSLL